MKSENKNANLSLMKVALLVFIPTIALTSIYYIFGNVLKAVTTLLLFFALAAIVLFPIEIAVILYSSKKDFGSYSLKSAFTNQEKTNWKQALIYGSILFAFAGLMSITVAPFENWITAPISNKLLEIIPVYFDWTNMEYIRTYPKNMLIIT